MKLGTHCLYLRSLFQRELDYARVKPTHALLFLTYRCTSRCKMCTIWKRGEQVSREEELGFEEWRRCIDQLCASKVKVIELFGGDALLRKQLLIRLIEYIRNKDEDIIIDFPTNGRLLDRETAKSLVKAGVSRLYLSLDGPPDTHDEVRGLGGSFTGVAEALSYLVEARNHDGTKTPEIICNCTISSLNVSDFEKIIPFAAENGADLVEFEYVGEVKSDNIRKTRVNGLTPTPFYVSRGSSLLLSEKQALLLKRKMRRIAGVSPSSTTRVATRHIDVLSVENLVRGTIPNKKCYICRYMVSVDPYGNVMGCLHFNNYFLGNIQEGDLSSIWNNRLHRLFMRAQKEGKIRICENCISGVHRNPSFFQSLVRQVRLAREVRGVAA